MGEKRRTCQTFPMARAKCLMGDFTSLYRIFNAHKKMSDGAWKFFAYTGNDAAEPIIDMQKWVEVRRQLHLQYISSLNKAADLLIYIQYLSMDLGGCKRGWGKYRGQKQVSWTWISNYNHCIVWNVIIYPCTRYLLLAHTSANMTLDFHNL